MEIKDLEKELNEEYKNIGTISIKKMYEDTISLSKIEYVREIMDKINPLNIDKPVIVSKTYGDTYKIIDGYHRIKNKILNNEEKINVIVLESYSINRINDTLFGFLETLIGETIKFVDYNLLLVNDKLYKIEENEGCGGCSNGWSSINILQEFINKEIKINTIKSVEEDGDEYKLSINDEIIANIDTGWGNGFYGGDFEIKLIN